MRFGLNLIAKLINKAPSAGDHSPGGELHQALLFLVPLLGYVSLFETVYFRKVVRVGDWRTISVKGRGETGSPLVLLHRVL